MITLISHFYNEEKLLPWWIAHHRPMVDHAILIDHGSTDRSREVCAHYAPEWEIISSEVASFDAIATDFEVMLVERKVSGWKIALNTTEFLVAPDLHSRLNEAERLGTMAMKTRGVVMVDATPDVELDTKRLLIEQKYHGFLEEGWRFCFAEKKKRPKPKRQRLIHRYEHGAYAPGRHLSFRVAEAAPSDFFTLWYGYSPWTDWFKARKTGISTRIPLADQMAGRGLQHLRSLEQLDQDYRHYSKWAVDLSDMLGLSV
jgi:hypothetical protein